MSRSSKGRKERKLSVRSRAWLVCRHVYDGTGEEVYLHPGGYGVCSACAAVGPEQASLAGHLYGRVCPRLLRERLRKGTAPVQGLRLLERDAAALAGHVCNRSCDEKSSHRQESRVWACCEHVAAGTAEAVWLHPGRVAVCEGCGMLGPDAMDWKKAVPRCPKCLHERLVEYPTGRVLGMEFLERDVENGHTHEGGPLP
jgi:hypothetical protein